MHSIVWVLSALQMSITAKVADFKKLVGAFCPKEVVIETLVIVVDFGHFFSRCLIASRPDQRRCGVRRV
jgi:hypothetical protein